MVMADAWVKVEGEDKSWRYILENGWMGRCRKENYGIGGRYKLRCCILANREVAGGRAWNEERQI